MTEQLSLFEMLDEGEKDFRLSSALSELTAGGFSRQERDDILACASERDVSVCAMIKAAVMSDLYS